MSSAFPCLDLIGGIYCFLQIAQVVQAVKNTDNINAVGNGFFHKTVYHIIRIGPVTKNILSSEQHLQFGILKTVSDFSQTLPGIFFQKTKRSVKRSATPALYCMIASFVHFINDGKHHVGRHPRCNQ